MMNNSMENSFYSPKSEYTHETVVCQYCNQLLSNRSVYQKHMNEFHRQERALPFVCDICLKGFFSSSGLAHHIEAHKGYQHSCSMCDSRFQHKHNLKRHMEGVHKVKLCRECQQWIPENSFIEHLRNCQTIN